MKEHRLEVEQGQRFQFGANWLCFLEMLNEDRINLAEESLKKMLGVNDLKGKTFLDAGSGSGLFSLVARRLGANVRSFDYDPQSVACTEELKQRYFKDDPRWIIEEGSVLDKDYLTQLGKYDFVYSWGVLHHTGAMWQALDNVLTCVSSQGVLFIAIYNDQGVASQMWSVTKRAYNRLPAGLKWIVVWPSFLRLWGPTTLKDFFRGRPFLTWSTYKDDGRGMTPWIDVIDWVGGYPFEVAKPEELLVFCKERSFVLAKMKTCRGGKGCNEFVFTKK